MALFEGGLALLDESLYCAPEFRAVTFVSKCLYKFDPLFALSVLTLSKFIYFMV